MVEHFHFQGDGTQYMSCNQDKLDHAPFIYFWLCWVFADVRRLSLVGASRGYSLVAVHGLPIVLAFLFAEHRP